MTPVLLTENLLLRPFEHEDAGAFAAVMNHQSVAFGVCAEPLPFTPLHAAARILMIRAAEMQGRDLAWAIEGPNGALIGMVAMRKIASGTAELGFAIHPDQQGQGHARAALAAVLDWLAANQPDIALQVEVFEDQPAAMIVLEKLGFAVVGRGDRFSIARERSDLAVRYGRGPRIKLRFDGPVKTQAN
jgi:RimJ/RimL family protein N-acetyltransferase